VLLRPHRSDHTVLIACDGLPGLQWRCFTRKVLQVLLDLNARELGILDGEELLRTESEVGMSPR
jgi:hypothetical protein